MKGPHKYSLQVCPPSGQSEIFSFVLASPFAILDDRYSHLQQFQCMVCLIFYRSKCSKTFFAYKGRIASRISILRRSHHRILGLFLSTQASSFSQAHLFRYRNYQYPGSHYQKPLFFDHSSIHRKHNERYFVTIFSMCFSFGLDLFIDFAMMPQIRAHFYAHRIPNIMV